MVPETQVALLERSRELEQLGQALNRAEQGGGCLVLVEAPSGIGKTSLLKAASSSAGQAGFAVLRARASELERDFAFGCVRQLIEPVVAKATEAQRERMFDGAAGMARSLFQHGVRTQISPQSDPSFSMLHGLYWLLNNLVSAGPVALFIDDLHWCDTESLRFLNYLAPRLDGLPLAVCASTRSEEKLSAELARLMAGPETITLHPQPLSIEAVSTLCEKFLATGVVREFAEACRETTGGNPFFLESLLREVKHRGLSGDAHDAERVRGIGPAAVARAVLLRLANTPAAVMALVRAAAALGDGASITELARLAGVTAEEAGRAADLLMTLSIFKQENGLEFAHAIVREAVYAEIGSHERAELHARAARILAESGASEERIAAQIEEAPPSADPERVALLRHVAAEALARGAPAAAIAWLRRALAEPPLPEFKAEVLLELGTAELRLAIPEAAEHIGTAVEQVREPVLLTKSVLQLANALSMLGDADGAVRSIESAITVVEPQNRELALILEAELAAKSQQASLEYRAKAEQRLNRFARLTGATPGERLALASLAFQRARASESASQAVRYIESALAGGRLLGEQESDVIGPFYALVVGLLDTDAFDVADACLDYALSEARSRSSIPAQAFIILHRGWFALRRGNVSLAEADARTALELLEAHEIRLGHRSALALLIESLVEAGEIEAAEHALRTRGTEEIPPGLANNQLLEARGILRLAQGQPRAALDDVLEFGRRDELWGGANPIASRWRSLASRAISSLGDAEAARRMAEEDLERARRWGAASGIGIALRARAMARTGPSSVDRLREAADVLERSPARLEYAHTLADLGGALRRGNKRSDARKVLHEALHLAERCGARALAARAHNELRAAGGRTSRIRDSAAVELTVSERRVAELAARGRSNPEIAQALFVTRKTVETHLGHIYRKLGISSRWELDRALEPSPADR